MIDSAMEKREMEHKHATIQQRVSSCRVLDGQEVTVKNSLEDALKRPQRFPPLVSKLRLSGSDGAETLQNGCEYVHISPPRSGLPLTSASGATGSIRPEQLGSVFSTNPPSRQ